VVNGRQEALNPGKFGTKVAAHYQVNIGAGQTQVIRLLSIVNPDFANEQMGLMLKNVYLHPCGQMPAYEWNFSDVNPPVHAFATLFTRRDGQEWLPDLSSSSAFSNPKTFLRAVRV
jgi:hypothetical protein